MVRDRTFAGANVYLSRNLVLPEAYDALHDALRLNGATVFLCADPSRNSASDFHVISSSDHEKFADLRAKGCNLLGPQCILSCAKEHRYLPKQGYTCCLAMDGVKILVYGFEKDEKAKVEERVMAMGGSILARASADVSFVIMKNVLDPKYKWAQNTLKKPIVNMDWLDQCWIEHRVVPHEAYRILPFSGLTICVTRIPLAERRAIEKMIVQNGGQYSADLTIKCTHLVSNASEGDKYIVARRWGHIHIVSRKWVDQSIARRARLDEDIYPVEEKCSSRNDTRSSLKEQKIHHDNDTTSFHTVAMSTNDDMDSTLSQNVSLSLPDIPKFILKASDAPTVGKTGNMILQSSVAEDSETEDDLYLSNCRISLVGFQEKELSRLVNMIRRGGGSRYIAMNEKLTHIIVGIPSEGEKKEVRRLANSGVINVVKAIWLEECNRMKREVDVSSLHMDSELLPSRVVTCEVQHERDLLNGRKREREPSSGHESKRSFVRPEASSKSEVSSQGRDDNSQLVLKCLALSNLSSRTGICAGVFKGSTFCFSDTFPHDRRGEVINWVKQGGGLLVDDWQKTNLDYMIEVHGLFSIPVNISNVTFVSTQWIRSSLEEGCLQDVGSHIIYSPLPCRVPLPGFQSLRFCVSQYEEKDRHLLKNLCVILGAKFTEKLTKKVTHLLCRFTNGPKYEASCKWGIISVTAEWVYECVREDNVVATSKFCPKAVLSQDRDENACTVSQYPTQAAQMVSRSFAGSHLLSKNFRASAASSDGDACQERSNTSPRAGSESHNLPTISKASEIGGTSGSSVPGVADHIEHLLAESNKIFAADQTIHGQEVSEAPCHSIASSRIWLNRSPNPNPVVRMEGHHGRNSPNSRCHQARNAAAFDAFSETQTESQVVVYEEDLSGMQKIIDRITKR